MFTKLILDYFGTPHGFGVGSSIHSLQTPKRVLPVELQPQTQIDGETLQPCPREEERKSNDKDKFHASG